MSKVKRLSLVLGALVAGLSSQVSAQSIRATPANFADSAAGLAAFITAYCSQNVIFAQNARTNLVAVHKNCVDGAHSYWQKFGRSITYAVTAQQAARGGIKTGAFTFLSNPGVTPPTGGPGFNAGNNQFSFSFSSNYLSAYNPPATLRGNAGVNAIRSNTSEQDSSRLDSRFSDFSLWLSGTYARSDVGNVEGDHGLFYLGADYQISETAKIGFITQLDIADTSQAGTTSTSSWGWMVGPYVSLKLHESLNFYGRLGYGQADVDLSQTGASKASFDTQRFLATGQLTGKFMFDRLEVNPFVRLTYFQERQDAFTDGFGTPVAAQTYTLGRLNFGPKIATTYQLDNGMTVRPEVSLSGVWDFDAFDETASNKNDLFARLEGSVAVTASERISLTGGVFLDGLGNNNYGLWGGSISANINF